ncbi:hypothetical protein [Actinomadura rugatobispora]|uniref:Uncharacterized protein n=1 Tax=Actinomadura rugatobispora TaxID=1994 RepID=A0ABW1A5M0_9ACTN|nr:hypothetical protein GCM10010200_048150 [Actinomadura rugatobispora]
MTRIGREIIELCRERFGPPPRAFERGDAREVRLGAPVWLRLARDGSLRTILRDVLERQEMLLAHGRVVWGSVVQADASLFRRGRGDRPALVIYSPDPAFDEMPDDLQDIAGRLFRLRGAAPGDPDLRKFAAMLADPDRRPSRAPVPRPLVGSLPVYATTVLVARRHVPDRHLAAGTFPLIIHPETESTMLLPGRYWPPPLLALWKAAADGTGRS